MSLTLKSTLMFHILHNICLCGPLIGQTGMHFTIYAIWKLISFISTEVHDFHNNLTSIIIDIARRTIPTTKPFNKVAVLRWSKACEIAVYNKKHAFNRMKRTSDPPDSVISKRV